MRIDTETVRDYLARAFGHGHPVHDEVHAVRTWDDLHRLMDRHAAPAASPVTERFTPLDTYGLDRVDPVRMVIEHVVF